MKPIWISTLTVMSLATLAAAQTAPASPSTPPTKDNYLRLAAQVEKSLNDDDLKKLFPAAVDSAANGGGFFENFSENWTHAAAGAGRRGGRGTTVTATATAPASAPAINDPIRSVVFQSRLTWLAAQGAMRYPDQAAQYLAQTRHGAAFLETKQWDAKNGGFWWSVNSSGTPNGDSKHAYGNSFAIFALAASYKATHDQAALDAAKAGFAWLEAHSHDAANGGYYEQIMGDGSHQTTGTDVVGARAGQKSMNTHIHLLEAFTALLEVWPDDLLKKRTEELYQINLTKIYAETPDGGGQGGWLHMFFAPDWTPVAGRDSYGHDIESAYLFAEAAAALGKPDDPTCWHAGRSIVDHCLKVAFNPAAGYLNEDGSVDGTEPMGASMEWWVEAESLNALLLMHERFGKDDPKYWNAFVQQWNFIQTRFIDPVNGGWYKTVSTALVPSRGNKTDAWTEGYHQGRAMLNVTQRLRKLAAGS